MAWLQGVLCCQMKLAVCCMQECLQYLDVLQNEPRSLSALPLLAGHHVTGAHTDRTPSTTLVGKQ
jgi:hypothetical protein